MGSPSHPSTSASLFTCERDVLMHMSSSVAQLKKYYIQPVFDFTNTSTDAAVSYDNFNMWLHNSSYGVHYGSDTTEYNTHLN